MAKIRVHRKAFMRDGTMVGPSDYLTEDKGEKNHTPKSRQWSPEIKHGALKGWSKDLPSEKRHEILSGLVRSEGYKDTVSKLTWLRNISNDRETISKAKEDLPLPLGPSNAKNWPAGIVRSRFSRIVSP